MKIGGFLKQSLIDWEGMIAAVIFMKGCNFRCGYCHNPSLVLPDLFEETDDIGIEEILSYLNSHKQWLDGVVVTGGEPTINPDLPDLLWQIRQIGYLIKLDTNGSNPEMIKQLLKEGLLEYVAMDIKTVIDFNEYREITNFKDPSIIRKLRETISILRSSGIKHQFRTTEIQQYHSNQVINKLAEEFGKDPYIRQTFRDGLTINNYKKQSKLWKRSMR